MGQVSKEEFLGHTRGRLGCKEKRIYKKKEVLQMGGLLLEREREKNRKVSSVLLDKIKAKHNNIYKNLPSGGTEDHSLHQLLKSYSSLSRNHIISFKLR